MQKRPNAVTFKGNGITLVGPELKAGDKAPDFTCAKSLVETVSLAETPAKARLFNVVPSLDTGVCAMQTKKFGAELVKFGDSVACYTVSMDLPFAQARFCGAENITNLTNLSDTHNQSFGQAFGVLIDGMAIPVLCRAVFVVDASGTIRHAEYVAEVTTEPNYQAALKALEAACA